MIRSIIGHTDAIIALNRSLAEGRPAHAYLFAGPAGIGKATVALALARALNCREPDPPCDACSVCRRIDEGRHADVECIAPGGLCDQSDHDHGAGGEREIRICQIRRLERVLGLAPFEGGRRVLIVDPADALNQQAADAFLKTLEEPPRGTVIALVSANEGALSETIRSRCRRVLLRTLPAAASERALRECFAATPEQAATLTRLFGGRLGRAVQALRDPAFHERRAAMLDAAAHVATSGLVERFAAAERLADAYAKRDHPNAVGAGLVPAHTDAGRTNAPRAGGAPADGKPRTRADVFATLDIWLEWWRDLLLVAAGAAAVITNADRATELQEIAARLDPAAAAAGVRALRELRRDLEQNVNPRLALEACMLRLPRPATAGSTLIRT